MTTLTESIRKLINQTATETIDREIPRKLADLITTAVDSTFEILESVLDIVRTLTSDPIPDGPAAGAEPAATDPNPDPQP